MRWWCDFLLGLHCSVLELRYVVFTFLGNGILVSSPFVDTGGTLVLVLSPYLEISLGASRYALISRSNFGLAFFFAYMMSWVVFWGLMARRCSPSLDLLFFGCYVVATSPEFA